ncbi:motility associated factor glycosyltransferase family protein [Candidatus Riflebacteria bacterium]
MPENIDNSELKTYSEKNIFVLRKVSQNFAQLLESKLNALNKETIPFELSREGTAVSTLTNKDGKKLLMHSRYYPAKEAEKFIEDQGEISNLVVCFGFGNGYHIREILRKMPEQGHLVVVGVKSELVLLSFKYVDLTDIFGDPRMHLMIDDDVDRLAEFYYQLIDWKTVKGLTFIVHGPSKQLFPETYKLFFEKVRYLTRQSQGNLMTVMRSGTEFQRNTLKNLKNFIMKPGVKGLFNVLQGEYPAILVAAGPSLDKNVHLLKEVKGRVFIIATDTSIKPMLSHGIEPDIVVAADPCYLNSLDFQGLPPVSTVLVCEPMASPDIFRWHKGPQMVCNFGDVVVRWMETFTEEKGRLFAWGSISTTAFDLARKIGADPIIFIGQDLSFPFGKTHCRGTFHDERWQKQTDYLNTFEMKFTHFSARGKRKLQDIHGNEVLADEQYNIYRQWFENQIERTKARLVNATEGGVLKKGYEILTLRQAITKYCQKSFPVQEILHKSLENVGNVKIDRLFTEVKEIRRLLSSFEVGCKDNLEQLKKLTRFNKDAPFPQLKGKELETFKKIIKFYDSFMKAPCVSLWYQNIYQKDIHRFAAKITTQKEWDKTIKAGDFIEGYGDAFKSILHFIRYLGPIMQENYDFVSGAVENYKEMMGKESKQGVQ